MTTGKPIWYEDQYVPFFRNGRIEDIYWTFSYSPAYGDDGRIRGVVVTCTETTKAVADRKDLQESEERFRTMAESSNILIAIAIADETGKATYFNRAWSQLTGRSTKDLLLLGWADLIHPDDRDRCLRLYTEALAAKTGIVLTTSSQNGAKLNTRALGATDFITKPDSYIELKQIIGGLLT